MGGRQREVLFEHAQLSEQHVSGWTLGPSVPLTASCLGSASTCASQGHPKRQTPAATTLCLFASPTPLRGHFQETQSRCPATRAAGTHSGSAYGRVKASALFSAHATHEATRRADRRSGFVVQRTRRDTRSILVGQGTRQRRVGMTTNVHRGLFFVSWNSAPLTSIFQCVSWLVKRRGKIKDRLLSSRLRCHSSTPTPGITLTNKLENVSRLEYSEQALLPSSKHRSLLSPLPSHPFPCLPPSTPTAQSEENERATESP